MRIPLFPKAFAVLAIFTVITVLIEISLTGLLENSADKQAW
jgi:hypothetical protein